MEPYPQTASVFCEKMIKQYHLSLGIKFYVLSADEVIISFKKAHDEQKKDEEIYDSVLLMMNSRKWFYWSKSSGLTFR
jgi:hypothetical protein